MTDTGRWPQRRRKRVASLPAPPGRGHSLPGDGKAPPLLVPARRRDAAAATGVILLVAGLLAFYLLWLLSDWPPDALPARLIYAAIGLGTIFILVLLALSLIAYVIPRLLGIRRKEPPAQPGKG